MSKLKNTLKRQQFDPGFLGVFINPFYLVRRSLWKNIRHLAPKLKGRVLDIGCGSKPYEELFTSKTEYIGMEIDSPHGRKNPKADVFYTGTKFPFDAESFDSAVATQTIEHIFNPDEFIAEIGRILKKGGKLLVTVPFVWDEHEQPYDYARYSSFGISHLLKTHGFKIVEHKKSLPDTRVIFQPWICYIHKKLAKIASYRARMILYICLISPFTILGIIIGSILPRNPDLYMDNVILAEKI
jgi:SAM-dependent methyltransferase